MVIQVNKKDPIGSFLCQFLKNGGIFMLEVIENIENLTEEILSELQNGLEEGENNE